MSYEDKLLGVSVCCSLARLLFFASKKVCLARTAQKMVKSERGPIVLEAT